MSINIDLTKRRALVTGVSNGIGAGIALVLAQAGCDVVGCGLDASTSPCFCVTVFPIPKTKRAEAAAVHPVGRLGTPADIGALCAFLGSPMAGFISGSTILIDGGRSAVLQDN